MASILSLGKIIYSVLSEDAAVSAITTRIFPVVTDSAELPCIAYARVGLEQNPVKGWTGSDACTLTVNCYTADYSEGVTLAEAVRSALDNISAANDGIVMRGCTLIDADESYEGDAYLQSLTFRVRI